MQQKSIFNLLAIQDEFFEIPKKENLLCVNVVLLEEQGVQQFTALLQEQFAMAFFREGRLSSGMAASVLGIPRAHFLIKAMQEGATLLENTPEDFRRETVLL